MLRLFRAASTLHAFCKLTYSCKFERCSENSPYYRYKRPGWILPGLSQGYEVHGVVRRDATEDSEHRLVNIGYLISKIDTDVGCIDNNHSIGKIFVKMLKADNKQIK